MCLFPRDLLATEEDYFGVQTRLLGWNVPVVVYPPGRQCRRLFTPSTDVPAVVYPSTDVPAVVYPLTDVPAVVYPSDRAIEAPCWSLKINQQS